MLRCTTPNCHNIPSLRSKTGLCNVCLREYNKKRRCPQSNLAVKRLDPHTRKMVAQKPVTYAQIRESAVKHWPYLRKLTPIDLNDKLNTYRRMYSK